MRYVFILLLALSVLTVSCEKITNVTLVDETHTGALSYKLSDDAGNGLNGVKVSLYDTAPFASPLFLDPRMFISSVLTDKDGVAYFPDLAATNYLVVADSAMVNTSRYRTDEYVQVVAGLEKKRTVKVTDFSGTLSIRVINNIDYSTPRKNLGVVAFAVEDERPTTETVKDFINNSSLKGVTDQNGYVSIKVPYNVRFDFILHEPNGNLGYGFGSYSVEKGKKTDVTLYY